MGQESVFPLKKYQDYEYPRVSILLPTLNSALFVSTTIEQLLKQKYPDFEIIVVDGGSTDLTVQVVKNYRDPRIHLYVLASENRYVQINKGIMQATGEYINILFPGDFYIDTHVLTVMMEVALEKQKPHLVYCGALLRDGRSDPKILYRPFSLDNLRKGKQPTSLQSCWFRKDLFSLLGKFSPKYTMRAGFDFMCRFLLNGTFTFAASNKVMTDYDLHLITRSMIRDHFKETSQAIYSHFGFIALSKWFISQKNFKRFLGSLWKSVKIAFSGQG